MGPLDSLPCRPLAHSDVAQLRAHETVDEFIELEPERVYLNSGLKRAVALVERTVVGLSFEEGVWNKRVLARDADDQRLLDEALKQLD
ncbi:MAG TPA: hypothetical protein VFJ06_14855 [Halococcus sp.]|nr:hypothetical protein [Halococcus sp.]